MINNIIVMNSIIYEFLKNQVQLTDLYKDLKARKHCNSQFNQKNVDCKYCNQCDNKTDL